MATRPIDAFTDIFVGRIGRRGGERFGSEFIFGLEAGIASRHVYDRCRVVGRAAAVVESIRRGVALGWRTRTGSRPTQLVGGLEG